MSILSTNTKLVKVGQEYSAGSGISIDNYVISVTGDVGGKTYSAGENIGIYEQDNQFYISGKDWSNDIEQASANAYEQAIAQIPEPQDLSYISAKVDTNTSGIDYISSVCLTAHQDWTDTIKGASSYSYEQSTSYFDNWVEGQYTGDITNITNKITAISGNFDDYYKKTETSSKDEINDALQYVSANAGKVYEGVSPIVVNNTEDKISADTWTFSAGSNVSFVDDNVNKITRIDCTVTGEGGDPQVNSFVYENSAKINDVNSSYQSNSGTFLTAIPSQYATTGDVAELAQTISETYYPNTNPSSFVNEDWVTSQGYITGVDLSNYAERDFVLSSIESATSGKLDVSSFASVSSDFLTTSFEIPQSANWEEATNAYEQNSGSYLTEHQSLSGCVKYSDVECGIGTGITAFDRALAQGNVASASNRSFAQGYKVYAGYCGLAQGELLTAHAHSLSQGSYTLAYQCSLAQGRDTTATYYSVAQGQNCSATQYSQSFGNGVVTNNGGMGIGIFNKTYTASFVIGNGTSNNNRSDSFIIFHDGSVSAAGKISANGVELGGGVTGEFVPQSAFDELKASYDALSSLFATYSGQWLLPNEGEE